MRLYLYLIDGTPRAGTDLSVVRSVLEANLRERPSVSDIWWDDEVPYIPRQYLYGTTHADYLASDDPMEDDISWQMEDQLIFPVEVDPHPSAPVSPIEPLGATMTLSVILPGNGSKTELTRVVSQTEWDVWTSYKATPCLPLYWFAVEAADVIGKSLRKKEGS